MSTAERGVMSCHHRNIKFRQVLHDKTFSHQNVTWPDFVIIPVFCACMIAAMGSSVSMRHAIIMPFEIEMDTEYILAMYVGYALLQHLDIARNF